MTKSAKILKTSFFVLCTALDSDNYHVPKLGGSFSPFDPKYGVKLIFEEDTFGDGNGILEFKVCVQYI